MTPRVLITRDVATALDKAGVGSENFRRDLSSYFSGDYTPSYMGRDGDFDRPPSAKDAELRKIHLLVKGSWPDSLRRHDRTCDSMIVYARHYFHDDVIFVLALLHPDAHEKSEDLLKIGQIADIAEKFRMRPLEQLLPQRRAEK